MKNTPLKAVLEDIGLTENEAKVYLAALSLGPTTALKIAGAAAMKRTTVYSVIESLKQKGLINIELKGWKRFFAAEAPEKLESILEVKRNKFKNLLPELSALCNLKESGAFLKYYEGLEAVKSLYEALLKESKPGQYHLVISHSTPWFKLDPEYFQKYIEHRAKLGLNIRLLLQESETARRLKKFQKNYNMKIRVLPKGSPLSINTIIVPNKIIFHQLKPPVLAIVVENQSLIQLQKELFEIIWDSLVNR